MDIKKQLEIQQWAISKAPTTEEYIERVEKGENPWNIVAEVSERFDAMEQSMKYSALTGYWSARFCMLLTKYVDEIRKT